MCICERVCYDAPDAHTLCSHARSDDTALHGMCASATLSLHEARSMGTLTHVVLIDTINARSYIPARSYMEDRITDACVRHESAHVLRSCARGTRSDGAVDASRAVVRGGTAGARACVRRCVGMRTRGCQRV
jgi:hypothetical protein